MVGDDAGKFWGGLVGLGTGREDNIIPGMGSRYLVKLESKACRSLQWLWNCNDVSITDVEKGWFVCLFNTYR